MAHLGFEARAFLLATRGMILVEARPLFRKLNAYCLKALEGCVGLCVARSHPEVTVEHFLLRLLDEPACDLVLGLEAFDAAPAMLARSLEASLEQITQRTSGKPVFSPIVFEWIQDAWTVASIELGHASVRSGALLRALTIRPTRYLTSVHPTLERVRSAELTHRFAELFAASLESEPAAPAEPHVEPHAGALAASQPRKALARFATNFTELARQGRIDPVFGRDAELRQVIDILARRRKNNPIVVGEAGVGKTAIVEGLALRIAEGDVPELLKNVELFALDLGAMQAGAGVRGEFESRLKAVIEEVRASAQRVMLFIDEAHTIIGAGGARGRL
jgi:type VI secretion system protein VasG